MGHIYYKVRSVDADFDSCRMARAGGYNLVLNLIWAEDLIGLKLAPSLVGQLHHLCMGIKSLSNVGHKCMIL